MFLLRNRVGSKTAKKLARLLGCRTSKNLPTCKDFIVSYGRRYKFADLNGSIFINKLTAHKILAKNVSVPKLLDPTIRHEGSFWVLGRRLSHSRGRGIEIIKDLKKLHEYANDYDYFVKYIPILYEYRTHILGGECVSTSVKVKVDDNADDYIRCCEKGWKHREYTGKYHGKVVEIGKQAIKTLGYDFGAVDIILGRDKVMYVLEVNSAPSLIDRRLELYADYFKSEGQRRK